MDPNGIIVKLIKNDVIKFYVTCAGINPMEVSLKSINLVVAALKLSVDTLITSVEANNPLTPQPLCSAAVKATFDQMDKYVTAMTDPIVKCGGINGAYKSFVWDAVCTNGMAGIYNIWAVSFLYFSNLQKVVLKQIHSFFFF